MTENRIRPIDDIRIELYDDNGMVDAYQGSGYHTVDEAIRNAFDGVRSEMNIIQGYKPHDRHFGTLPNKCRRKCKDTP